MCFHGINMLRFIVCFLHLIICLVVNEVFQKMIFIKTRIVTYISNFKTLLQTNILQNASNLSSNDFATDLILQQLQSLSQFPVKFVTGHDHNIRIMKRQQ